MPEIIELQMDVPTTTTTTTKVDDLDVSGGSNNSQGITGDARTRTTTSTGHKDTNDSPPMSTSEKRLGLITAMGQFRPKSATPIQFYNFVREFCIMHNCSIDEAMERAPIAWSQLSKVQTQLYNSEMHAALPIPVPHHLIYRAIQMQRAGRWKLASMPATKGSCGSKYTVESFAPPPKPNPKPQNKHLTRIRAQQPRWDNLAETSPYYLNLPRARPQPSASASAGAERKARTLTPPEQRAQLAQQRKSTISLKRILTQTSLKGQQGHTKHAKSNLQQPTKSSLAKSSNKVSQQQEKQEKSEKQEKQEKSEKQEKQQEKQEMKPETKPESKQRNKQQPKVSNSSTSKPKKVAKKVSSASSKLDNTEKRKRSGGSTKKKLTKSVIVAKQES